MFRRPDSQEQEAGYKFAVGPVGCSDLEWKINPRQTCWSVLPRYALSLRTRRSPPSQMDSY
ncbi:hypothetical protein BS17DRAFT_786342, partial [Gyrodon lividus]